MAWPAEKNQLQRAKKYNTVHSIQQSGEIIKQIIDTKLQEKQHKNHCVPEAKKGYPYTEVTNIIIDMLGKAMR